MKLTLRFTSAVLPFILVQEAFATDYSGVGGDPGLAATWTPSAAGIISGGNITPLANDRLIINGGDFAGAGVININAGAQLTQLATGQHLISNHINLAGTGVDGLGAIQNLGNDWIKVQDVQLTANTTIRVESGGWRQEIFNGPTNQFNLNGKTLSITGSNNWYWVNTAITGGGVINVDIRGEFNCEAGSVIPAGVTVNLLNTRHSSWDGAGQVMGANYNLTNSIIETRQNDQNKTYAGNITITGTGTFRTGADNGTSLNHQIISGPVSGTGTLIKDGADPGGIVNLNNGTNSYSGGTVVNAGILRVNTLNAIPSGTDIKVNGGSLDIPVASVNMGSGSITGGVTGTGTLIMSGVGTKTINAGAAITNTGGVQLTGGILSPTGNNALAGITGTLAVTDNATLRPTQAQVLPGLNEYHRNGADLNANAGITGATASGVTDGIPAIDSTAKPFGDNNAFIYTGQIVNTTAGNIGISFGEQYDDQIRIKVDGATVLFDTGWNTATASGVVNLTPGAHDIEINSFDGAGGAGPNSGWDKGVGVHVGPYTITDVNGGGDNGAFSKITLANLAGIGLTLRTGAPPASLTESKAIAITASKTLSIDTSGMSAGNTYTLTGNISGGGNIAKIGAGMAILSGITTTTGSATVTAGNLSLRGTHSFSSISVASGATLSGSGSSASAVGTISSGGHVAPGNSVGTLTLGSLSVAGSYDGEASANGVNDLLVTTTGTTWSAGASFNLSLLGGYVPLAGASFDFVNGPISGTAPAFNLPALSPGLTWNTSAFMTTGVLSVVPEPSNLLLAAFGLGVILRRRRR
jgi:autotransporter-associated beta strand protein